MLLGTYDAGKPRRLIWRLIEHKTSWPAAAGLPLDKFQGKEVDWHECEQQVGQQDRSAKLRWR